MTALERLAEACGVLTVYRDAAGAERRAAPETLCALLAALGEPVESETEAEERLAARQADSPGLTAPPSVAVRGREALAVPLRSASAANETALAWWLTTEAGETHTGEAKWGELELHDRAGGATSQRLLQIPGPLPNGYHRLVLALGVPAAAEATCHVIAAPAGCHLPEHDRQWGVSAQLYSLVSEHNWGLGDYGDVAELAGRAGRAGADFLGLSPVHALFTADPGHFGPYGPSNRSFHNTAYIDPSAVPGVEGCARAQALMAGSAGAVTAARGTDLVDYAAVDRIKRPVLEALWAHYRRGDAPQEAAARFRAFRGERGHALDIHALFEALHERFFARGLWHWRDWPAGFRDPHGPEVAAFAEAHRERLDFFAWLQWIADEQLAAAHASAHASGMAIGLYTDLAVGLDPGGSAAWSHQHLIPGNIAIGAPPDDFNQLGQNWGLAPLSPVRLSERGFDIFAAAIRASMRHAGAMRIDHAMQLARLFWIPPGGSAAEGTYVRYSIDEMLAVIALESERNRCIVIGEDLGTVPEGFRERLSRERILTYKLLYFERDEQGGFAPPEAYPREALVAASTHDLATLRGLVASRDLDWRERLDLFSEAAAAVAARRERADSLARLTGALQAAGLLPCETPSPEELIAALHAFLAASPSRLMAVQAEDLAGALDQPNLPGTIDEHPNWRRKLPVGIDALLASEPARYILKAVTARRGRRAQ